MRLLNNFVDLKITIKTKGFHQRGTQTEQQGNPQVNYHLNLKDLVFNLHILCNTTLLLRVSKTTRMFTLPYESAI